MIIIITIIFMLIADAIGASIFVALMLYVNPWVAPIAFVLAGLLGFPIVNYILVPIYLRLAEKFPEGAARK